MIALKQCRLFKFKFREENTTRLTRDGMDSHSQAFGSQNVAFIHSHTSFTGSTQAALRLGETRTCHTANTMHSMRQSLTLNSPKALAPTVKYAMETLVEVDLQKTQLIVHTQ